MTRTVPRPTATLPPVTLTPEEAAAVAVALAARPEGPYSADGGTALEKVLAALEPDPRRRDSLRASSRLVREESARSAGVRSAVERGVAQRRVLVLAYRDGRGTPTRREVEPQLIARTADREYLVAWCRQRQAPRWFRWDRIERAEVTAEPAPRRDPATFGAPPVEGHPAGRALGRPVERAAGKPVGDPRLGLVLVHGGRSGEEGTHRPGRRPTLGR
jgi:predicted DNA-binding transcriptional regulator YafY